MESALYFALADKQWNIAAKLYDAGDRLDDLITECELPLPWQVLDFLAGEMRYGRNYFSDESRTLSECCRCSAFKQIEQLMPEASLEELNKSIKLTVFSWRRNFGQTDLILDILKGLKSYGAKLSDADRVELQTFFEAIRKWPAVMQPAKEDMQQIAGFIENA